MASPGRTLDALFYPQIVCLDENVLKYLLLVYDRIFYLPNDTRLNPGFTRISSRFSIYDNMLFGAFGTPEEAHRAMMYASEPTGWDDPMKRLMETYDLLEDKGVCVPLQEEAFDSPYAAHPLEAATDSDMQDSQFHYWCDRFRNPRIHAPNEPRKEVKGRGMLLRPPRYRGDAFFTALCSERINTCLYFAGSRELVPVSNHDLFIRLYGIKLKRALSNPSNLARTAALDRKKKAKFSILSWQVLSEVVPPELVAKRTAADILRYKAKTAAASARFREYLFRLEASLAAEAWDDNLQEEIDRLVRTDVLPELEKLRDQKADIWGEMFGDLLKSVLSKPKVLAFLTMHLVPGMSYLDLLAYSSGFLAADALPKLVDAKREELALRRNALFFVLNLGRRR